MAGEQRFIQESDFFLAQAQIPFGFLEFDFYSVEAPLVTLLGVNGSRGIRKFGEKLLQLRALSFKANAGALDACAFCSKPAPDRPLECLITGDADNAQKK